MRIGRFYLTLALLALTCQGCRTPTLPAGTYTDASESNKIAIAGGEILVHLANEYPTMHSDERCRYRLSADQRIVLILPSTRYQTGVGRFDYFWTGKGINVIDPKTGRMTFFSRKE